MLDKLEFNIRPELLAENLKKIEAEMYKDKCGTSEERKKEINIKIFL